MANDNNHFAGRISSHPSDSLNQLDPLVGKWKVNGSFVEGLVAFAWMEGGFFMIQHVELHRGDATIKGVEYIRFDEDTKSLKSHYMDNLGSNFTYTWSVEGRAIRIWFGDQGSENFFVGTFDEDMNSFSGRWQWPGGGYEATMTRMVPREL